MQRQIPHLTAQPVWLRHVRAAESDSGRPSVPFLGRQFEGYVLDGWSSGDYERRMGEEATATIVLPNVEGGDGVLHRERFKVLAEGRPTPDVRGVWHYTGGVYRPGDEWIEVREGDQGDPLFVGTPIRAMVTRGQITLTLVDGWWLLKKARETAAGFWHHAPRDAWQHYTGVWRARLAEDFGGQDPFAYAFDDVAQDAGELSYLRVTSDYDARPSSIRLGLDEAGALSGIWLTEKLRHGWHFLTTPGGYSDMRIEASTLALNLSTFGSYMQLSLGKHRLKVFSGSLVLEAPGVSERVADQKIPGMGLGDHSLAVELRGRWVIFYYDAAVVGVMPAAENERPTNEVPDVVGLTVSADDTAAGDLPTVDLYNLLLRVHEPMLMQPGIE